MERVRATWTDERLDDLSRRVEDGFNRNDEDMRSLRTEVSGRFDAVDGRFDALESRIDRRFESLESRFDALQRTMILVGGGTIATLVSVLATRA